MGILSSLFGGSHHSNDECYQDGFSVGEQYAEEWPELDRQEFAQAQQSTSKINRSSGHMSETEDDHWQSGFVDGYNGNEYGESQYSSINSFPEEESSGGGLLGWLFGR